MMTPNQTKALRRLYKSQIEALAAIATMAVSERRNDLDRIPRDSVMREVQKLRTALDAFVLDSEQAQPTNQGGAS